MTRAEIERLKALCANYGTTSENAMRVCTAAVPALIATVEKLEAALKEVVTISNRKHVVWDRARALLAKMEDRR